MCRSGGIATEHRSCLPGATESGRSTINLGLSNRFDNLVGLAMFMNPLTTVVMQADGNCSKWICRSRAQVEATQRRLSQPQVRLFCIPPAGTGTWVYQNWWKSLPDFEVLPIELPGSGLRSREPRKSCMESLVKSMVSALTPLLLQKTPYAIFGHSMGAWVAFELSKEVTRQGMPLPVRLIVSGNRAPHLAGPQHDVDPTVLHTLCYTDFWPAFERRYGPNPDLAEDRVRRMVWPSLQADFMLVEMYKASTSDVLLCPLTVVGAMRDRRYTSDQVDAWRLHTCRDYMQHWVVGQHDYIIKSAISSGLMTVIHDSLLEGKPNHTQI